MSEHCPKCYSPSPSLMASKPQYGMPEVCDDPFHDTPKPEPQIEPWMRSAALGVLVMDKQSEEVAAQIVAAAYAPERARLRRELLALAKKWVTSAGNDFYPTDTCASDIRAFIDRELPEQK